MIVIYNYLIKKKDEDKKSKELKRYRDLEKIFKHVSLLINKSYKIDDEQYRNYILLTRLYIYIEKVIIRNSNKNVWVIENNALVHVKVVRLYKEERERRNIKKIN